MKSMRVSISKDVIQELHKNARECVKQLDYVKNKNFIVEKLDLSTIESINIINPKFEDGGCIEIFFKQEDE